MGVGVRNGHRILQNLLERSHRFQYVDSQDRIHIETQVGE